MMVIGMAEQNKLLGYVLTHSVGEGLSEVPQFLYVKAKPMLKGGLSSDARLTPT